MKNLRRRIQLSSAGPRKPPHPADNATEQDAPRRRAAQDGGRQDQRVQADVLGRPARHVLLKDLGGLQYGGRAGGHGPEQSTHQRHLRRALAHAGGSGRRTAFHVGSFSGMSRLADQSWWSTSAAMQTRHARRSGKLRRCFSTASARTLRTPVKVADCVPGRPAAHFGPKDAMSEGPGRAGAPGSRARPYWQRHVAERIAVVDQLLRARPVHRLRQLRDAKRAGVQGPRAAPQTGRSERLTPLPFGKGRQGRAHTRRTPATPRAFRRGAGPRGGSG